MIFCLNIFILKVKITNMLNTNDIITEICKASKNYFPESSFYMAKENFFKYYSSGNNTTKAVNHYKNSNEEINVVKWFDDFWVYLELNVKPINRTNINTSITLSVFQGDSQDNIKYQLFRAEWDTYNDNKIHPQPHWHFYSNSVVDNIALQFVDIVDKEKSDFLSMLSSEKPKCIEINKMHFAMRALWDINPESGHIHKITQETDFINWYKGLLSHIKTQLEFAK